MKRYFWFLFLVPMPAFGQLFGGIVSDPLTHIRQTLQQNEMVRQTAQAAKTYQQVQQQYQLWQIAMRSIKDMPQRYRAQYGSWRSLQTLADTYGQAGKWSRTANTGTNSGQVYKDSTNPVVPYATKDYSTMPPDAQRRVRSRYATLDLSDAGNATALGTIGQIRAQSALIDKQLANLENDSMAPNASMMETLQQQKASAVMALRMASDQNKLLLSLVEAQIINAKQQRDAEANAMATNVSARSNLVDYVQRSTEGMSAAISNWRLP